MEKIKEFYDNITKTGWIVISAVFVLILIVILVILVPQKGSDLTNLSEGDSKNTDEQITQDDQFMNNQAQSVLTVDEVLGGEYRNDYESATVFVQNSLDVSVAVYFEDEQESINDNGQKVCGKLTFVTTRLPKSSAIINETLKAVFANKITTDFEPGNIIPLYHPNLIFDNATIDNGVVRVYLKGDFAGNKSDNCGLSMALTQISETVKKIQGVKSVEIYQNLQKIN
jgi:hypothetical protein